MPRAQADINSESALELSMGVLVLHFEYSQNIKLKFSMTLNIL